MRILALLVIVSVAAGLLVAVLFPRDAPLPPARPAPRPPRRPPTGPLDRYLYGGGTNPDAAALCAEAQHPAPRARAQCQRTASAF